MSDDGKQKSLNEGVSSEILKKGLSSSNLQSGLGKPPAAPSDKPLNTDTSANTSGNVGKSEE